MTFLHDTIQFHKSVFQKIALNKIFFIFLMGFYLLADMLKYYQPYLSIYLKNENLTFMDSFINFLVGLTIIIAYMSYACLWSLYFKRREKTKDKLKAFFAPLINFRLYVVYFSFVFIIILGLSLSIRFIPELNLIFNEALKIFTDKANSGLSEDERIALIFASEKILTMYNEINIFQMIGALITFFTSIIMAYFAIIFSLPLVLKNKSNKAFKSMKTSIQSVFTNFKLFILTIGIYLLLKTIGESIVSDIDVLNKVIPIILDSILFFYIVIGLENFILTKEKNSV